MTRMRKGVLALEAMRIWMRIRNALCSSAPIENHADTLSFSFNCVLGNDIWSFWLCLELELNHSCAVDPE